MSPKEYYQERIQLLQEKLNLLQQRSNRYVALRLVFFLAIPLCVYFFFSTLYLALTTAALSFGIFLFVVRKSIDVKAQIKFNNALVKINEDELQVLAGDFSAFDEGESFKNDQHPFTYDMDFFGAKSIFQYLNRAVSAKGKALLAQQLSEGVENVEAYHEATEALLKEVSWTQDFRAKGKVDEGKDETYIDLWSKEELVLPKWLNVARIIFPIIAGLGLIAKILDRIPDSYFMLILMFCLIPVGLLLKRTNEQAAKLSKIQGRLDALRGQLILMRELKATSRLIDGAKSKLFEGKHSADNALEQLKKTLERFDLRMNFMVSIVFNMFGAYDLQMMYSLSKWKKQYAAHIHDWEKELLDMEVLISQMNFRYNYQSQLCYPVLEEEENASIKVEGLGHPFLLSGAMVTNDFELKEKEQFVIITGPNMAGKSTFLRSIGVNLALAQAGFAVVAKEFKFPKLKLYSSMRTADNLTEESSYFHAELIRLRFIVDAIDRGEKIFIVLDEILKGTNSKDKEEGSAKFLKKLIALNTKGIIATHDLSLTKLADEDSRIKNQYFDSIIEGDNISFSYKMHHGVVKNMNASFLLEQMKLV